MSEWNLYPGDWVYRKGLKLGTRRHKMLWTRKEEMIRLYTKRRKLSQCNLISTKLAHRFLIIGWSKINLSHVLWVTCINIYNSYNCSIQCTVLWTCISLVAKEWWSTFPWKGVIPKEHKSLNGHGIFVTAGNALWSIVTNVIVEKAFLPGKVRNWFTNPKPII